MNQLNSNSEILRLQKENLRLRRALEELSILNEIAVAINSALSLDRILESIVQKCTKHLKKHCNLPRIVTRKNGWIKRLIRRLKK